MPPEKRKARAFGSPITTRAPSSARIMSSIPARRAVPGATRLSAERSFLSLRGSTRIESHRDRLPKGRRRRHADSVTRIDAFGNEGLGKAELAALGKAPLGLGGRPQAAGEADLREAGEPLANGRAARGGGDRDSDAEIGAR